MKITTMNQSEESRSQNYKVKTNFYNLGLINTNKKLLSVEREKTLFYT